MLVLATVMVGCQADRPPRTRPAPGPPLGAVTIHSPVRLTGITTGAGDPLGRPVRVACVTCHSLRKPDELPTSTAALDEFHQGLTFDHGSLRCGACHLIGDQSTLHLADGAVIAMTDAIQLCRQCHGPQARDYDHGAHGGMTGFWDLSAGGRTRNHCVDCHDVHAPQFQPSQPVLPPHDRGLTRRPSDAKKGTY